MKVKTVINLDFETGNYDIEFFTEKKEHTKIDQKKLAQLLRRVFESWDQKFQD
jgi:hypothetical protein